MPAPTPAFREGVNVLLARTEEIQKVHAHVFAGFADAEENQVVAQPLFCGYAANYLTKHRERFDRMFRIIIIPRHTVEA